MNLHDEILRINILMTEQIIPNDLKRRIDAQRIEKLINHYKLSSFQPDNLIVTSVVRTCAKVSQELIPPGYDEEEYNRLSDSLRKALNNLYGQELTEYFQKRKEEYKNREPSDVMYVFKKDYNGIGFSEGIPYFYDLLNKYGDWLDIDWGEVKNKLDKINDYPVETFSEWKNSYPLRISSVGDDGNKWGYDFFIIKSKKK